jgi:hypothetical protein
MYPFPLPSGINCVLREMTGVEEELITNGKLLRSGDAVNQLLCNCMVQLGENSNVTVKDVLDLLAGDRLFILVKLRQISLGDEMIIKLNCPNVNCQGLNQVNINLDDLTIKSYPAEREFSCTLPGSGLIVKFDYLDGHKEKRLAALPEATISQGMLIRILEIDGKSPNKKTVTEMSLKDRQALRQAMLEVDGGIDTAIDIVCQHCGQPIRTRVEADAGFFFPNGR